MSALSDELLTRIEELERLSSGFPSDAEEAAFYAADSVIPAMEAARRACDSLEAITDKSFWPIPTYSDILFYV